MKMIGNGVMGQRRRYLAEQEVFMAELFAKAEGFTTPITKPVASFKAPSMGGAPKTAAPKAGLKPTGGKLPTSSERLAALKQNLADKIGQTGPSTGAPTAVGTVGKADRYSSFKTSQNVAHELGYKAPLEGTTNTLKRLRSRAGQFSVTRSSGVAPTQQYKPMQFSKALPRHALYGTRGKVRVLGQHAKDHFMVVSNKDERLLAHRRNLQFLPDAAKKAKQMTLPFEKREPLKTSIGEDDARKLIDRHGLKGPLPKNLTREQKMAAYEARYVSAGGKKAEKWQRRAETAEKVRVGGLGVATVGGAGWLATRGKGPKPKVVSPGPPTRKQKLRYHADTVAVGGAVAGGAAELYAGHARRKRSSYASAPAGVAASALRRMQDYTKDA